MGSLCHSCITPTHLSYSLLSLKLPPPHCAVPLVTSNETMCIVVPQPTFYMFAGCMSCSIYTLSITFNPAPYVWKQVSSICFGGRRCALVFVFCGPYGVYSMSAEHSLNTLSRLKRDIEVQSGLGAVLTWQIGLRVKTVLAAWEDALADPSFLNRTLLLLFSPPLNPPSRFFV